MEQTRFLFAGLLLCGFVALAVSPVSAQPLRTERAIPLINGLPLEEVSPEVAEKLAMPAKPIALHLQNVTLIQALNELQKQSGVRLDYGQDDEKILGKKLSLDLETLYFRPAFDAILKAVGVEAFLSYSPNKAAYSVVLGRAEGKNAEPLLSGLGPFQVSFESLQLRMGQTIKMGADKKPVHSESRGATLVFGSATDPRVDVAGSPLIILQRVEDDQGRSLFDAANANANKGLRYNFFGSQGVDLPQDIDSPALDAKRLSRVEGKTIYVVSARRQHWEIEDVTGKKDAMHQFQSGGREVSVRVKSAERKGNLVNINLEMSAPPIDDFRRVDPLFSLAQMPREFSLQDANGNMFYWDGNGGSTNGDIMKLKGNFILDIPRDENGKQGVTPEIVEPIKLVFDGPTEWVQTQVPFSFSDVPLP